MNSEHHCVVSDVRHEIRNVSKYLESFASRVQTQPGICENISSWRVTFEKGYLCIGHMQKCHCFHPLLYFAHWGLNNVPSDDLVL